MFLLDAHMHSEHSHGSLQEGLLEFFERIFHLESSPLAEVLSHFVYDLARTLIIFLIVLSIVSFLKTYVPFHKVRSYLLQVNKFAAILLAAAAGVFSSTCICTNVPIFIGFIAFGIPLHLAMTYLISASLINITSLLSMLALTGGRFTLTYVITSFCITVIAGIVLSFFSKDKYIYKDKIAIAKQSGEGTIKVRDRVHIAVHETMHTLKDNWIYLVVGVAVSAIISGFVNFEYAAKISELGFLGTFIATALGPVLHTDIIIILPVVASLLNVNMTYGILIPLVFSLSFFSIPMLVMVKKTIKLKYMVYVWITMFVLILIAGGILLLL